MSAELESGDELRNPRLNDPDDLREVAERVDPTQGFEIEEPLPGEDVADDGYETALAGRTPQEPDADADALDNKDVEAGLAEPYTSATNRGSETHIARDMASRE